MLIKFMLRMNKLFIYCLVLCVALCQTKQSFAIINSDIKIKKNKSKRKRKSNNTAKEKSFIEKYVLPRKNQIFQNDKHSISIFGGYNHNSANASDFFKTREYKGIQIYSDGAYMDRTSEIVILSYSLPTRFARLNGRLSFGAIFYYLQQNINHDIASGEFTGFGSGFEVIQEIILGHKNLYFTVGLGIATFQNFKTSAKTDNEDYNDILNSSTYPLLWNNSCANFAVKASIGHRFNCGLIIEANFKHYSNGMLSEYNWGFNYIGGTIGWTF